MANAITVTPTQRADGTIAWTLCYRTNCGGPAQGTNYPEVKLPATGESQDFTVTIGQPDLGLIFDQDPLWMAPGKGKKPTVGQHGNSQIHNVTVNSDGKVLTFTDENSNLFPKWFSYQLNFVQGSKKVVLDPDWKNGGGGFSNYFGTFEATIVTLVAAALLLLLGAWIGRFTLRRRAMSAGKTG
jgi:hypothetical protein